jgi:hypothetical protein
MPCTILVTVSGGRSKASIHMLVYFARSLTLVSFVFHTYGLYIALNIGNGISLGTDLLAAVLVMQQQFVLRAFDGGQFALCSIGLILAICRIR